MANRREILAAAAGGLGLHSLGGRVEAAPQTPMGHNRRDLIELRRYAVKDEAQKQGLVAFFRDAAIPALNRIGITPVGVFHPEKDLSPVYVLLRHATMESLVACNHKLLGNEELLSKGSEFLNATADKPAYQRMESALLLAFKGMPTLDTPVKSPGRVLQLRIYESPSERTGQKKIEMFNDAGEIAIFRRAGLRPVFFGESLVGSKMPNLTYMLAFESPEELKANWAKFVADPEWKKISQMPEYSDKAIISGITNLILKPAECSQV